MAFFFLECVCLNWFIFEYICVSLIFALPPAFCSVPVVEVGGRLSCRLCLLSLAPSCESGTIGFPPTQLPIQFLQKWHFRLFVHILSCWLQKSDCQNMLSIPIYSWFSKTILPSWSPNPHHLICQLMILSLNSEHHGSTSIGEPIPLSHWGRYLILYMQYRVLLTFLEKYPRSASSLFQVYNDIVYGKPGSFFFHSRIL